MGKCYVCYKNISSGNKSGVCNGCKFDKSIVISSTDTKRKYKLTDVDLLSEKLFSFKTTSSYNYGYAYIIKEIEEFAKEKSSEASQEIDTYIKERLDALDKVSKKDLSMKNKLTEELLQIKKQFLHHEKSYMDEFKEMIKKCIDACAKKDDRIKFLDSNVIFVIKDTFQDANIVSKVCKINMDHVNKFLNKNSLEIYDSIKYLIPQIDNNIETINELKKCDIYSNIVNYAKEIMTKAVSHKIQ